MSGWGDIVQKAFYLGVGLASYAGEKAGGGLVGLAAQIQKLADEMVAKGEMSTEEARRFVEEMIKQDQQKSPNEEAVSEQKPSEPRRIEILQDEEPDVGDMRSQV